MKQLNWFFLFLLNVTSAKHSNGFSEYNEKENLGMYKKLNGLTKIHNENSQIKKLSERHFGGNMKDRRAFLDNCAFWKLFFPASSQWTGTFSEEQAYSETVKSPIFEISCSGSSCDDKKLRAGSYNIFQNNEYWTGSFSEEGNNKRLCSNGWFVKQIHCSGSYCDNLNLKCSPLVNGYRAIDGDLMVTEYFSEEGAHTGTCEPGYFVYGVECGGSNCDNIKLHCKKIQKYFQECCKTTADTCKGACAWTNGVCSFSETHVNCGNHQAKSCSLCPDGNGHDWCDGECVWTHGMCVDKSVIEATTYDANAGLCGPLFEDRVCDCSGTNKYCDTYNGFCGNTELHKNSESGITKYDCPSTSDQNEGRCGPLFGGRVCDCHEDELYCNTANGWCGNTDAHKNAQSGNEYDCPITKPCNVANKHWLGDGYCDSTGGYNTAECGWDGGDCCEETCVPTCGDNYKCVKSFDCKSFQVRDVNGKLSIADNIINSLGEEEMMSIWLIYYFDQWGIFPMNGFTEAFKEAEEQLKADGRWEKLKEKAEEATHVTVNHIIDKGLNNVLAREIVKASVKGGKDKLGRRAAMVVVDRGATLAASQSAKVAYTAIGSVGMGLATSVAEIAATAVAKKFFGVESPTVLAVVGIGASVLAGVISGAVIGGPVGAFAGLAVGVVSWFIGEGISALFRTGQGPSDNWCYIVKASNIDNVNLYTYNADDGLRWVSYWSANTGDSDFNDGEKVMSAGQAQDESFQLEVGDAYFAKVFYQDTIFIGKNTCHENLACHCGSGYNEDMAGRCVCKTA